MEPEYEARFCDIDAHAIAHRLKTNGAQQTLPRTLMRRIVFKNDDITARGGWLRLRDQGNEVTLTYKQTTAEQSAIDSILEAEIVVSDFQQTRQLLEAMNFTALRYQENYREEWHMDGVTYDIDTWPDLPTFLEIEGPGEQSVRSAAAALGLNFDEATYGSVDEVYLNQLGRDILSEPTLTFETPAQ
ncbi:CYTH domain-containing protein [Actinomadura fulvescens]|uniref:CYTH domain-containing protein n=1 Tax=Actinomadura fulvescens TaxID=46160 RepID=A0ABN3Q500_9ACTN